MEILALNATKGIFDRCIKQRDTNGGLGNITIFPYFKLSFATFELSLSR